MDKFQLRLFYLVMKKVNVSIVGAKGYSGAQLVQLFVTHPNIQWHSFLYHDDRPHECADIAPNFGIWKNEVKGLSIQEFLSKKQECDIVFLATPNDVSLNLAPRFIKAGYHTIDLSGAFRLNSFGFDQGKKLYQDFYKLDHNQKESLESAIYGLQPWAGSLSKKVKQGPLLVANPGCYVTSVLMPLIFLFKTNLFESEIIVDAKSGTSGAGKKMIEGLIFSEMVDNFYPYKIGNHQHRPEMEMFCKAFSGHACHIEFVPHLLPTFRGIQSTIYLKIKKEFMKLSNAEMNTIIENEYEKSYSNYPLFKFGRIEELGSLLTLRAIQRSPCVYSGYKKTDRSFIVSSFVDNLMKGAASQAIENLNSMLDLPLWTGLLKENKK